MISLIYLHLSLIITTLPASCRQDKEKQIEAKRKELSQLQTQQGVFKQKAGSIEPEFDSHKEYCSLIAEIIENLELSSQSGRETKQIFQRFVDFFQ